MTHPTRKEEAARLRKQAAALEEGAAVQEHVRRKVIRLRSEAAGLEYDNCPAIAASMSRLERLRFRLARLIAPRDYGDVLCGTKFAREFTAEIRPAISQMFETLRSDAPPATEDRPHGPSLPSAEGRGADQ